MMTKSMLRKELIDSRNQLDSDSVKQKSKEITTLIQAHPKYKSAKIIAIFYPMSTEVSLLGLTNDQTKCFVYPKILDQKRKVMGFAPLKERFIPGIFHTTEPDGAIVEVERIDLFLVPGLAFSKRLDRLGYGAGYYDRYLKQSTAYKIGVCYDFQLKEELPSEDHDVLMDEVISI